MKTCLDSFTVSKYCDSYRSVSSAVGLFCQLVWKKMDIFQWFQQLGQQSTERLKRGLGGNSGYLVFGLLHLLLRHILYFGLSSLPFQLPQCLSPVSSVTVFAPSLLRIRLSGLMQHLSSY